MKVANNKIITFRNSILTTDKEELNKYRAKVLFSPSCIGPKLFSKLDGAEIGNVIEISYSKEELGSYDPENMVSIPKAQLNMNVEPVKGMMFKTKLNNMPIIGHISSIEDETITLDLNHPLLFLNQDVIFQIEIYNIEEADQTKKIEPYDQFLSLLIDKENPVTIHDDPF